MSDHTRPRAARCGQLSIPASPGYWSYACTRDLAHSGPHRCRDSDGVVVEWDTLRCNLENFDRERAREAGDA